MTLGAGRRPPYAPPLRTGSRFPAWAAAGQDDAPVTDAEWEALAFAPGGDAADLVLGPLRLRLRGASRPLADALAQGWDAFLEPAEPGATPDVEVALRPVERLPFAAPVAFPALAERGPRAVVKARGLLLLLDRERGEARALVETARPGQELSNLLRFLLMAFAPGRGAWLVHAAAVELARGGAALLLGASQSGKTTAARLAAPRRVLGDDAVLLERAPEGGAVVCTAGLWGREGSEGLAREGLRLRLPLAALVTLRKAAEPRLRRLPRARAALALSCAIPLRLAPPAERRRALEAADAAAAAAPGLELEFTRDDGAFWGAIEGEARRGRVPG